MAMKAYACPRCLTLSCTTEDGDGGVHTCSPSPFAAKLETRIAELEAALKPFAQHHICEDSWYSCPMSEDGCSNDAREGCTCGAEQVIEVLNRN